VDQKTLEAPAHAATAAAARHETGTVKKHVQLV